MLWRLVRVSGGVWLVVSLCLLVMIHMRGQRPEYQPADAIVVLGAGIRENGSTGFALRRRVSHAVRVYRAGYAPMIICSGGFTSPQPRSEADACRDLLVWHGIPAEVILIEDRSLSTEQNAIYTSDLLEELELNTIVLVTDSFHLWRARWLFQQEGVEVVSLAPVPSARVESVGSYGRAIFREVLAVEWQFFNEIFNLQITHIPYI